MADLRLIAVALGALAACAPADAQPPSGIKPPAGWQPQPAVANAAKAALGKTTIDGIEAYGEPAMGCNMVWMSLRAEGSAKELAAQIARGLVDPKQKRALEVTDVVSPTGDDGLLTFSFASAPAKGRLRARLGKGKIVTLACWWSDREPKACEAACTTVLGGLP